MSTTNKLSENIKKLAGALTSPTESVENLTSENKAWGEMYWDFSSED